MGVKNYEKTILPSETSSTTSEAITTETPTPSSSPSEDQSSNIEMIKGVYVGNDPNDVIQYENWLGAKAEGILAYTGDARHLLIRKVFKKPLDNLLLALKKYHLNLV
jgi:hypothetical protein